MSDFSDLSNEKDDNDQDEDKQVLNLQVYQRFVWDR